ncbi:MAG: EscU/YscU/HrcU family type III secretion system export apparatus switch protein [Lachnospirales bacterium]
MDKNKKAIALKYDKDTVAPEVVAKGAGHVAEKILEIAKDKEIPIYEDAQLADELANLDLGENIPPELYEVVAKILIFIGDIDKSQSKLR